METAVVPGMIRNPVVRFSFRPWVLNRVQDDEEVVTPDLIRGPGVCSPWWLWFLRAVAWDGNSTISLGIDESFQSI